MVLKMMHGLLSLILFSFMYIYSHSLKISDTTHSFE